MYEPNLNSEFYEDEGDPLAEFRKQYRGAVIGKNGADPFKDDPDIKQADREDKLREEEQNKGMG